MAKKVLITAGSHAEIPLIQALHKLGYYVITTGNNLDGLGHAEADEYAEGDFSKKDAVLNIARENEVVGIVSGCNDFAYLSTAYACEQLGLPGHDTYETSRIIHHKDRFREELRSIGIRTPKIAVCGSKSEALETLKAYTFPCMIKAVDLTGGKGIKKAHNIYEAEVAIDEAFAWTREKRIIVEEFVEGENHGFTCLLKGNKVVFGFLDNEQYYKNPYLVSGAYGPSDRTDVLDVLKADIEKLSASLKLADGLFHVQIIIDKEGYPVMIDPCRRAPGDLYLKLVEYSTGVPYAEEIVKAELGLGLQDEYSVTRNFIARECVMSKREGIYKRVNVADEAKPYIIDKMIWGRPGDNYRNSMTYKAGIIFMKFADYDTMVDVSSRFHDLVQIEFYDK